VTATTPGTARRRLPVWFLAGLCAGAVLGVTAFRVVAAPAGQQDGAAPSPPRFVEETNTSGIRHVYDGDFRFYVGGGAATFDCDADGRPDLYLAGGEEPAGLYHNESSVGGELRFSQVTDPVTDLTGVTGAYPIDIDADGQVDLAVLRVGENVLLRGLGGCRFERANEAWSFDGGKAWTEAFSATWEDPAGLPTLAFGNYLDVKADEQNARGCSDSAMYRPDPGREGYGPPTALAPGLCTLSILFADWNHTGRHDLRMANDRHYYSEGEEQLWKVDAGEPPRPYTHEEGWQPLQIWGMGIASYDVTGDGLPEVFLTSQGDNRLQTLVDGPERPTYGDIAIRRGVTAHRPFMGDQTLPSTAWHPEFADVNNDGLIDLYISKGNVDAQADHAAEDPSNLLIGNPDGTFTERAREAGIVSFGRGRGAALADFNLDGMLDLVEVNRGENVKLWRNVGAGDAADPAPMGNWVALRLEQPGANRDGIGAWLEVRTDRGSNSRQLTVGGGHASGQLGWIHVGLGEADQADVRVQWPDGETGPWVTVDANTFAVLERGAADAAVWTPPST
jgi:enediyne biosynthesis protein E4